MLRRTLLLLCATVMFAGAASAQIQQFERSRLNTAAYYNYAEASDVTVHAHVWGAVRYPGLYEVPTGTHLSELLSLAGGPQAGERFRRTRRQVTVRLWRDGGSGRATIYDQTATNGLDASGRDPQIIEGDVMSVESVLRQRFSFRDVFPLVAAFASVALAIERIAR